jgi:hypothetical protein
LRKQYITSEQLLQWFLPIDVPEKYQMNLNHLVITLICFSIYYHSSLSFANIQPIEIMLLTYQYLLLPMDNIPLVNHPFFPKTIVDSVDGDGSRWNAPFCCY